MIEHDAGRHAEDDRSEAVTHPAGLEPSKTLPVYQSGADDALYLRLMDLGAGVQADFDEALAELAK